MHTTKTSKYLLLVIILSFLFLAQSDYENWKKQEIDNYTKFADAHDKAFVKYLEQQWKEFESFKGLSRDDTPKPQVIPSAPKHDIMHFDSSNKVKEIEVPSPTEDNKANIEYEDINKDKEKLNLNFWGIRLDFNFPATIDVRVNEPIEKKTISDFWYQVTNYNYKVLVESLNSYQQKLNLNDWAYCQLLNETVKKMFESKVKQNLFAWFLLLKSQYECKIGYNDTGIYLLLPAKNIIYDTTYIVIDGKNYYIIDFERKVENDVAIFTYKKDYPGENELIDLNMDKQPKNETMIVQKQYKFTYGEEDYTVNVKFDRQLTNFYQNYPHSELDIYFNSVVSNSLKHSLAKSFKPVLEGKSEAEAVNILLRFVQTAFAYQTDSEQFGYEKVLFPEETLFYPSSDCEDRAVLFSFLVNSFLGLEVVGLDYPGHIATAVKFNTDIKGDAITFKGKKYYVCDPTYINADIGIAMPKFKKVKPEIIEISRI